MSNVVFQQYYFSALFLAPTSGCDLITSDGKCFSYFASPLILWLDARANCQTWGGDLASIASGAEGVTLRFAGGPFPTDFCHIGLNDIETEGTYVWSDGSNSSYRNWINYRLDRDCVTSNIHNYYWYDHICSDLNIQCYYCGNLTGELLHTRFIY